MQNVILIEKGFPKRDWSLGIKKSGQNLKTSSENSRFFESPCGIQKNEYVPTRELFHLLMRQRALKSF